MARTHKPLGGLTKRAFDISVALITLVLLAPLMALVAALLWLVQGGPVIYAHSRIGLNGRAFQCLKFRTMRDGPAVQKLREHDPRITPLGRILRKSSLDELPQLINVLRGEMSLIGPRPVTRLELRQRYGSRACAYFRARPGITGLWQVRGRSTKGYAFRARCDCLYVHGWSLALDLQIALATLPAVLRFNETV